MRKKNLAFIGLILVTAMFIISVVNAEIIISQPRALYNLGDQLSTDIKIDSIKGGYMDVNLVCDNGVSNVYHNVPDAKTITITRQLTPLYIENLSGRCSFSASYGGEMVNSQSFSISKLIEISFVNLKTSYDVDQNITIKGTATEENNQLVGQINPAFIEINLGDNISSKDNVNDGQFNAVFNIPETLRAGRYTLNLKIYDEDNEGNILNSGEAVIDFEAIQKPAKLDIALEKVSFNPGENITLIPFLYDLAGDTMASPVVMKITDSNSRVLFSGIVNANENFVLETNASLAPGEANIILQKDGLNVEKAIDISSVAKLNVEIENNTVTFTNIGNVPYNKIVEVTIGSEKVLKEINLAVGEKIAYDVSAPNGQYNLVIKDDQVLLDQTGVALTGSSIGLSEVKNKIANIWANYPVVWIFLVIVLFLLAWTLFNRYRQNRRLFPQTNMTMKRNVTEIKKGGIEVVNPTKMIDQITGGADIRKAEQVLVLQGKKQQVAMVSLKVKNQVKGIAKDNVNNALQYAYKNKAVSYLTGDYIILIFSPLITKNINNEEIAVKTAIDIDNFLKEHNRKFRNDKIDYGIGVNSGELINKIENRVLQFANMGKTLSQAKKISEIASDNILLSKELHEKTMNTIKTDKFSSGAMDLFSVKRIVDTEKSQKFINEFLRRN